MMPRHPDTRRPASPCFLSLLVSRCWTTAFTLCLPALHAQTVSLNLSDAGRAQVIDGFGTCISGSQPREAWWQELYLDDFGASVIRVDLVPRFKSPWSDHHYYSPWFKGSGRTPYALNFETRSTQQPRHYSGPPEWEWELVNGVSYYNGPDGNRARTYTGPADYGRSFGGFSAPIAVMGPNIDDNISRTLDLDSGMVRGAAAVLAAARSRDPDLARFKLVGSIWSPAPWLKVSSGTVTGEQYGAWPFSRPGTPRPHIASDGSFVGGRLDVSGLPLHVFDDSGLPDDVAGGPHAGAARGPTSALTQFARSTAAYVRGFQNRVGARFYAISIQNELNFETFYNSCTYPRAEQYLAALKAVRAEFDKYDDLRGIRIKGPEDLLQGSDYALWQFGSGENVTHKNLRYLTALAADSVAAAAVDFFCIHGYAADGASSAGADPVAWRRWAEGWTSSPAAGLPSRVLGFTAYGKRSWMTETSGEASAWLSPSSGFPSDGAWSIALKIHQALVAGRQNAWLYWQFSTGSNASTETLTGSTPRSAAPKYVAMKHFSAAIRPGAVRHEVSVTGENAADVLASSYVHEIDGELVVVLINRSSSARSATLQTPLGYGSFGGWRSASGQLWQTFEPTPGPGGAITVPMPGYSVVTLRAEASSPGPAYRAWRNETFSLAQRDAGLAAPLATPFGDGVPNLLRFSLGTSASDPALPAQPSVSRTSRGRLALGFRRARGPGAVTYEVLAASSPAGPWATIAVNPGSPGEDVLVEDDSSDILGRARFMRLRVSLVDPSSP